MRNKAITHQRPLFTDRPAWHALPTEVCQQVERLLANVCLDVVNSDDETNRTNSRREQDDEPRTD